MKVTDLVARSTSIDRYSSLAMSVASVISTASTGRATAGRLVGDHAGAEHRLGGLADLVDGLDQLDAAGLAAAAGVDLCLHHPVVAADGLGRLDGLLARYGRRGPAGTGMPYSANSCLAWYSWKFMRLPSAREGAAALSPGTPGKGKSACRRMAGARPRKAEVPCRPPSRTASASNTASCTSSRCSGCWRPGCSAWWPSRPLGLTMAEIREPVLLKLAAAGYFLAGLGLLWPSLGGRNAPAPAGGARPGAGPAGLGHGADGDATAAKAASRCSCCSTSAPAR